MNHYTLYRTPSADDGTFGTIEVAGTVFHTAELPWRGNKNQISCIPVGVYTVVPRPASAKFNYPHYHITNVQGRDMVLIHVGNYAGDTAMGYKCDVQGCILIGEALTKLNAKQRMITNSKKAFAKFMELMENQAFELEIVQES
jgi:hypothetical protein